MRAGKYAVLDGVTYQARFTAGQGPGVGLIAPVSGPCPPGFVRDERFGWWGRFLWEELDEAFEIEVWARVPGGWVVQVDEWDEETGRALVTHMTHKTKRALFGDYDEPAGEPPYLRYEYYDAQSWGWVAGDDLTDVRTARRDVELPGRRGRGTGSDA